MTDAEIRVQELEAVIHVPGNWICDKCHFTLTKSYVCAKTGSVGADLSKAEPCPNDGTLMRRVTWEERSKDIAGVCEGQILRACIAEEKLTEAKEIIKGLSSGIHISEHFKSDDDYRKEMDLLKRARTLLGDAFPKEVWVNE